MVTFFVMCYTYILYSKTADRFYIGSTCGDLYERIRKHNSNHKGYTGKVNDWELMHHEAFQDVSSARKREMQIKGWKSRKMIEALVNKNQ